MKLRTRRRGEPLRRAVTVAVRGVERSRVSVLSRQLAQAEAAAKSKSEFLAVMSHEIRTPLNGVIGTLELALMATDRLDVDELLQLANDSARSLAHIVDDTLEYTKMAAGHARPLLEPFDVEEALRPLVGTTAVAAARKCIGFQVLCAEFLPVCMIGSAQRLRQIVANLLGNAIKFTRQGVVTLELRHSDERGFELWIKDTGPGMSRSDLARLFQPYEQLGDSRQNALGTGLGLAIVKRLVDLMGGRIEVSSHLDGGTSFHLQLPWCAAENDSPRTDLAQVDVRVSRDFARNFPHAIDWLRQCGADTGIVHETSLTADWDSGLPSHCDLLVADMTDGRLVQDLSLVNDHFELVATRGHIGATAQRKPAFAVAPTFLSMPLLPRAFCRALLAAHSKRRADLPRGADPIIGHRSGRPPGVSGAVVQRKLLLVENDPTNQIIATRVLCLAGWRVFTASTGEEALALATESFDVALIDLSLGDMTGIDVARRLRQASADGVRTPRLLAWTAQDRETIADADSQLFDAIIAKPILPFELAMRVQAATSDIAWN